jgi:tRNA threonylcarbamoyladenosine modification (KEOPS) complex  Pcc1 subunit
MLALVLVMYFDAYRFLEVINLHIKANDVSILIIAIIINSFCRL